MIKLTSIISISGKPGLYKVVAQAKNSVIVESLEDNKKIPAYATDRISALEDISIYTYNEEKPLKEIYADIYKKENGGATISHKEDAKKLQAYFLEILPEYDQERVYVSDLKKLFQWYNLLHKSGNLVLEEEVSEEATAKKAEAPAEKKEKKAAPAAKKPVAAKATPKPKTAAAKPKTTVQRKSGS
ncbi:MAG TPA: DUF5606 domain-containing protein [Taishania sp.]|nr:DUF5606 domain-containing protein [Taishania sp.]HNS41404.1 DUF5606 domain-containing protein [Taishania sp.]